MDVALARQARRLASALLGLSLFALGACSASSADPGARMRLYESHDSSFGLEYVTPPWEVEYEDEHHIQLYIAAEAFGVPFEDSAPSHFLYAARVDNASLYELLKRVAPGADDALPEDLPDIPDIPFDLPEDFPEELPDTDGDGIPMLPDYLDDVDLEDPREVAFADFSLLMDTQRAQVASEPQHFVNDRGQAGLVYEVILDPGVFVRTFYFRTNARALRVVFESTFDLETFDIDMMARRIYTDVEEEE